MPYIFLGKNIVDKEGDRQDELYNAGIDIRNEPSPYLTTLYSINPDFSQLEKQVTDIDFSYTEKEVDDPRPFFQEGSSYFGNDTRYFYSNRVPDFDAGAKVFYHKNDNHIGAFLTRAPDDRWDAVVRYNADLGATHNVGAMLISSRREELDNDVAVISADGRQQFGLYYGLDIAHSSTDSDEDIGSGESYEGTLGWQGNHYSRIKAGGFSERSGSGR